jgi:Leucine-rich repeat (LRR) protein
MTRDELLALIDQAARRGWRKLDLRGRGTISESPPKIGELAHLRWLILIGNRLTAVPPAIGQLANLKQLDLSENR